MLLYIRFFCLSGLFLSVVLNASAAGNIHVGDATEEAHTKTQAELKQQKEAQKVRALQRRLIDEGYYSGPVNGVKSSAMRRAVKAWSRDRD